MKLQHNQPPPDPKVTSEKYEFRKLKIRSQLKFSCDETKHKQIVNAARQYAWYHDWKFIITRKGDITIVYREK